MFADKTINKIFKIHHKTLQVVYNQYDKSKKEHRQLNNKCFYSLRNLRYLALGVFRSFMYLNPEFL